MNRRIATHVLLERPARSKWIVPLGPRHPAGSPLSLVVAGALHVALVLLVAEGVQQHSALGVGFTEMERVCLAHGVQVRVPQ